jgi:exopolyphosphatase/guanosine-5'-triphosphate,3'-diphosphate pyrophosphatase
MRAMDPGTLDPAHRELRAADLEAVREQLGRDPTTPFTVVARCSGGHPLVIRNAPYDANGDPFPTMYWLTCPEAAKAVSRLESQGWIARLNERVQLDEEFDLALEAAHRAYARERGGMAPEARSWGGVAGTRTGVKCLHAHYAYHLAGGVDPVGAWAAGEVEPIHGEPRGRVAAIDQGTNSIRLLVAEPLPAGIGELARDLVITRLGEGVDATGELDPAALRRTIEVLATYCRRASALCAERIRVAATSAVRDATASRETYAAAVREHAGTDLEVLTGEREAGLSFLGATHGLDPADGPFLVLDIGGGSTELVTGSRPGVADHAVSTRIGSVRLTERHVRHDPPTPSEIAALEAAVEDALDEAERSVPAHEARTLVACAGTPTTLQAISLGLSRYDPDRIHRTWLGREEAERIVLEAARMTTAELAELPVMARGRGDVIVAGAVVLVAVMRRFEFDRALVSETDILDGLAFEMLGVRD